MAKLFYVDDESGMRSLFYDYFTRDGHGVLTAVRGQDLISTLQKEKPDIIILDQNMPGEKGVDMIRKIRASNIKLPILLFSGDVTSELEKEAYGAGASEVVAKAAGMNTIKTKIDKLLAARECIQSQTQSGRLDKLLIVDDEEGIRKLLEMFFKRKNIDVLTAASGEEALKIVKEQSLSAVLLDINMPGMDGLVTLKKMKELKPNLAVVMASGMQDEQVAREAISLGAYHYVTKPFDLKYMELVVLTRLAIAV